MISPAGKAVVVAVVTVCAVALGVRPAGACSCAELPSPCMPDGDAVVFTGRVVSLEPFMESMTSYRLSVSERFRGDLESKSISVTTQRDAVTCGYPFEPGVDYLVFAWTTDTGALFTSLCTLTGPVASSRDYLELLREMKLGAVRPRLRGSVAEAIRRLDGSFNNLDYVGVAGAEVTAAGDAGRFRAKTDDGGGFLFRGVPPGRYTVTLALPRGYEFLGWPDSVVMLDSCLATRTISVVRTPLEGVVRDPDGRPLTTPVRVGAVRAGDRGDPPSRDRSTYVLSERDGTWRFAGLPPGRYHIGTNLFESPDDTPFQSAWHTDAGRPARPAVVTVSLDRLARLELQVGPLFERTELHGLVTDRAGVPVAHANLMLTDVESARDYLFAAFTETDGRFTIPAVKGRRYRISAAPSVDPPAGDASRSSVHDVGDFGAEIRLIIPGPPAR